MRHMVVHTQEKSYQCSECECGKAFFHKRNLKEHMVVHTQEKNYLCSECGKAFGLKGNLKKHMVVHTGATRFKCTICNKQYSYRSSLTYHMMIHSNHRPYKCFCMQSFRSISNLKEHSRKHLGEKLRCPCEGCDKKYVTKRGLKYHLQHCSYSQDPTTMTNV